VRADRAAGDFLELVNRLHAPRFGGIRVNVVNEDFAAFQPHQPELSAIIPEAAVMRFVTAVERMAVNDRAVARRTGFYVQGDEFVRTVAESGDSQRPDIDEFLLAFDAGEVG